MNDNKDLKKLSMDDLQRASVEEFRQVEKFSLMLVLDNLRSALNVGSIFRTADAFALESLVLLGITACPPHREILKTALGSTASVAWTHAEDGVAALQALKSEGYRIYAIEQTNNKIWLQDFMPELDGKYAFVLGNEVEGVSEQLLAHCDGVIEIPQYGTKHSLNVAVTAGIVAWEFVRKYSYDGSPRQG